MSSGNVRGRSDRKDAVERIETRRAALEPGLWGIVLAGGEGICLGELAAKIAYPGCPKQYADLYEGRGAGECSVQRRPQGGERTCQRSGAPGSSRWS